MSADDKRPGEAPTSPTQKIPPRPAEINGAQRRYLRSQAHALKPIVYVGKGGLNEGVITATSDALNTHELIKVSAPSEGSAERRAIAVSLATATGSHVAQTIGHVILLFRQKAQKSAFKLPTKSA